MRTNPRPTGETIGFYYPDDYGPYIGTRIGEGSSEAKVATGISSIIRKVFSQEGNRIPKMAPGRLLEIGSASGKYLCQMEQLGWAVRGIEFSEHAASHARAAGLDVHTGTIESAPDPEQPYDLVVGWMVLEHLHDPVAALRRLHSWTRPEGRMVLSVPNASCWSFKLFKSNWYDLHLPNHLFHFTPRTLQRLLAQAGWELQTIHYQQNFATPIASLGYWLAERQVLADFASSLIGFPTGGSRWSYRAALPLAMVEALFRQSSRMTVWVRPRCNG
jgi:SAM-dependent methyltransferase